MRRRTALSLANLVAIVTAFVVLFEFPAYSGIAFYALVAWIFVGFGLMYLPALGRPAAPAPGGPFPAAAGAPGAPLPSGGPASGPSAPIDFCIYCGTTLPPGATTCAACGHRVPAG